MIKPVKTSLAAYGMSGRVFHAPLIHYSSYFELTNVMQRSSNSCKENYPNVDIVKEFDDLLDSNTELIIINTPDYLHYEQALKAIDAGKHVVLEKPFVQNVLQGEELINKASEKGVILSVFHNRRWDNNFLTVKKIIEEDTLGNIVEYRARYDRYRPQVKNSWKENPQNRTSILYNLGSHIIDQALHLFGMPQYVSANMAIMRDGALVDDFFNIALTYPNKFVELAASYLVKEPSPSYIVNGVKGSYIKYGEDPQEAALASGVIPDSNNWGEDCEEYYGVLNVECSDRSYRSKIKTVKGNYHYFYNNIYRAVKLNDSLNVTAKQALDVIRVIEAAKISSNEKRYVKL
ncbi:Gfo/Idh/MocA family oxidoreductase [Marinilabiliaceae bacterium ANBcel2]|nr:Gfo/Idh/MocA family oxidoreductase [Marinilabiliaceae bacterium ANBcel2]